MYADRGYCLDHNQLFVPLIAYDTTHQTLFFDRHLNIAAFSLNDEGHTVLKKIITITNTDTISDYVLKTDGHGHPIIIDEGNKKIYLSKNNQAISFAQLSGHRNMDYVYDITTSANGRIKFLGVLKEQTRTVVKGTFDQLTQNSQLNIVNNKTVFDGALFYGDSTISYSYKDGYIYFGSNKF